MGGVSAISQNRLPLGYLLRLLEHPVKDFSIQDCLTSPGVLVLVTVTTKVTMSMIKLGARIRILPPIFTGLVKILIKKLTVDKKNWMNCEKQTVLYRTKNFQAQTEQLQVDPDLFSLKRTKTIPSVLISFWTLPNVLQISDQVMEVTEEIVAENPHPKGEKIIRSKKWVLPLKMFFRFVNKSTKRILPNK